MNTSIQPLLITPFPKPFESLMGFILRTSELNGYESPNVIQRYAGMSENEIRSVRPPMDKLAQLYARDAASFAPMGYADQPTNRYSKSIRVLNHVIPAMYAGAKQVKVCPECINDNYFVHGFWDLKYAVACPIHKRMAITSCPSCGLSLKWNRRGLLECQCGHNFSEARGEPVEDKGMLATLELLMLKLEGKLSESLLLQELGFPIKELKNISMSTLLGLIGRMERKRRRETDFEVSGLVYSLRRVGAMFSGWPNGFYDYLESQYETHRETSYNLQQQFQRTFNSLFKSGLPGGDVAFLKKAFVTFGNERWKQKGFIDIRLATGAEEARTVVGISGLSKYLRVMPPTVMSYVRKGLIKGTLVSSGKRSKRLFDLNELPFRPAEGKHYRLREAAKFIGLPVKLFSLLKNIGIYKMHRLAWGIDGYNEMDLIEFREQLLSKVPTVSTFDANKFITIQNIIHKKLGGQNLTVKIITAILEDRITPVGRLSDKIKDIVLERYEIESLLRKDQLAHQKTQSICSRKMKGEVWVCTKSK